MVRVMRWPLSRGVPKGDVDLVFNEIERGVGGKDLYLYTWIGIHKALEAGAIWR
jgi:hypothetical protein